MVLYRMIICTYTFTYIYICKLHSGQMGLFLQTLGAISSKEVAVEWWNLHRSPTIFIGLNLERNFMSRDTKIIKTTKTRQPPRDPTKSLPLLLFVFLLYVVVCAKSSKSETSSFLPRHHLFVVNNFPSKAHLNI